MAVCAVTAASGICRALVPNDDPSDWHRSHGRPLKKDLTWPSCPA